MNSTPKVPGSIAASGKKKFPKSYINNMRIEVPNIDIGLTYWWKTKTKSRHYFLVYVVIDLDTHKYICYTF